MNRSEFEASIAKILVKLIGRCKSEVLMVSGSLPSDTYNDPELITAIKEARSKQVDFKVIIGSEYDSKSKSFLEELQDSIFIAPSRPKIHFAVGDGKHVRYEGIHESKVLQPANHVEYDFSETGGYLANIFSEAIKLCTPLKDKATI